MNALWLIGLLGFSANVSAAPLAHERSVVRSSLGDLPLTFEVNRGQTDARVDFLARGQGYTLYLTPTEAVFALVPPRTSSKRSGNGPRSPQPDRTVMRMQLVDSAPDAQVQGLDALPGKVNYFRGNDSSKWRANVPTYRKVRYTAVYPGVDLIYYGQPQQLEYDFIVAPGADPSTIKLAFTGIDDATVDAQGDLVLNTAGAPLRFHRPLIYQVQEGRRRTITGAYVHTSPQEIGFRVGTYDRTRPLIIDPVLSYSTLLGGNLSDSGTGIAVDASGATYVGGETSSSDFPTVNAMQPEFSGGVSGGHAERDAFVAKINSNGTALVYATYLGGEGVELETHIAVDAAGNAYVTGSTSAEDFPTVRPLQATLGGARDVFVAKLSADGSRLIYSTYLGGGDTDFGKAIAVDLAGAAYVTGMTFSRDFPAQDAFQPACTEPPPHIRPANGFVSKLTPDGTSLAYSTYLGGSSGDSAQDIAVDTLGSAYVTGFTNSGDFPTVNSIQPYAGFDLDDSFVTKFAPDGKSLIYSTHLGGSSVDQGDGIAADVSGAAYVTGHTNSSDFPTVNPLQPRLGGGVDGPEDAFVVKLPPEGGVLAYATYLGGSVADSGLGIAVDAAGSAYVTGLTQSFDFPMVNPLQGVFGGQVDAFVAKISPEGSNLVHSTYLGGSNEDVGEAIALDLAGAVYVTGFTWSANFPTVQPLQASHGGFADAFTAKLTGNDLAAPPGNVDITGGQDRSAGGGSIDALLAILLAQFALARARRLSGAERDNDAAETIAGGGQSRRNM